MAHYRITPDDVAPELRREVVRYLVAWSPWVIVPLAMGPWVHQNLPVPGAFLLGVGAGWLAMAVLQALQLRRNLTRLWTAYREPVTVTVGADVLRTESDHGHTEARRAFVRVNEHRTAFIVENHAGVRLLLPKRHLSSEETTILREWVAPREAR